MKILVIYGSLRQKSINKALALAMLSLKPQDMELQVERVPELPLYNQDKEIPYPPEAEAWKKRVREADGVIFVTPEYNRSIPAPLKNFIDWTSRPSGAHPWGGKPFGVMGASSGPRGTIVAQYDVKRVFTYFGASIMGQPELYVDNSDKKIDDNGVLVDERTKEFLKKYLEAFRVHVAQKASAR